MDKNTIILINDLRVRFGTLIPEDLSRSGKVESASFRLDHVKAALDEIALLQPEVKRLRDALGAAADVLARITLEPTFIADGCPGTQRTRYVVGADIKDDASNGAKQAKASLAESV